MRISALGRKSKDLLPGRGKGVEAGRRRGGAHRRGGRGGGAGEVERRVQAEATEVEMSWAEEAVWSERQVSLVGLARLERSKTGPWACPLFLSTLACCVRHGLPRFGSPPPPFQCDSASMDPATPAIASRCKERKRREGRAGGGV
jgi:hypothetical protein